LTTVEFARSTLTVALGGADRELMFGRRIALAALAVAIVIPPAVEAARLPGHTKREAEVNVLRTVARKWGRRSLPGIVNARTHLLLDNTEAVCYGRGKPRAPRRYTRFACVVRPHTHRRRQGLYVSYQTRPNDGFTILWLGFRRR
jgi:hypothetical protein